MQSKTNVTLFRIETRAQRKKNDNNNNVGRSGERCIYGYNIIIILLTIIYLHSVAQTIHWNRTKVLNLHLPPIPHKYLYCNTL